MCSSTLYHNKYKMYMKYAVHCGPIREWQCPSSHHFLKLIDLITNLLKIIKLHPHSCMQKSIVNLKMNSVIRTLFCARLWQRGAMCCSSVESHSNLHQKNELITPQCLSDVATLSYTHQQWQRHRLPGTLQGRKSSVVQWYCTWLPTSGAGTIPTPG